MEKPHALYIRCLEDLKRGGVPIDNYFRNYQPLLTNCDQFFKCEEEIMAIVKEIEPKLKRMKELGASLKSLSSTIDTQVKAAKTGHETFKKDCRDHRWKVTEKDWDNMNVALHRVDVYAELPNKTYKQYI
jgi:hypothetical protein